MLYEKLGKLLRIIIGGAFCLPILACTTSGTKFHYLASEDLNNDPLYLLNETDMVKPKDYGAVKLQNDDMESNEGSLYILQKKKGIYQAETMFLSDKSKRYYFSFGMNYKTKTPHIGFRLEF